MRTTRLGVLGIATLFATLAIACRGKEPAAPPSTPPANDAGTTTTTSGPVEEPNSPTMTNSGTPNPPGRGDPPQILPPEITPK